MQLFLNLNKIKEIFIKMRQLKKRELYTLNFVNLKKGLNHSSLKKIGSSRVCWQNEKSVLRMQHTSTCCCCLLSFGQVSWSLHKRAYSRTPLWITLVSIQQPIQIFCCPIHLYLIFEKSTWKNQVQQTGFLVYFELDFYCLCSLQK